MLFVFGMLTACPFSKTPEKFLLTDVTGANFGQADHIRLQTTAGKLTTLADFEGKVTLVFFGYTHCPDVCPTTLGEMTQVFTQLHAENPAWIKHLAGVFITLDPARDSPLQLSQYAAAFHPNIVPLTGTQADIDAAAKAMHVFYQRIASPSNPDFYTIDHTAAMFVYDTSGRLRLYYTPQLGGVKALAHDIKLLLQENK